MKTPSKVQLIADNSLLNSENGILRIALNEVLRGKVQWFTKGAYKLGVIRPCGAEGGIVLQTFRCKGQSDYTTASYWEKWYPTVRDNFATQDREAMDLRELAFQAQEFILHAQRQNLLAA